MEKRKDTLSALKLCRFCLTQADSLTTLYDRIQKPKNAIPLTLKIFSCLSIEAFPSDRMPSYICKRCSFFMDLFYEYKELCRNADERIFQYIQNGSAINTMNWPNSLSNVFSHGLKSMGKNPQVVKAIVEGGATVQVTSQEASNSEDDEEENVYKIKIGDSSGDEPKCIQLLDISKNNIEEQEQLTAMKPINKGYYENQDDDRLLPRSKTVKGIEDGCWPCNECDCTYPLQQLLELHMKQKHRERTVHCDQCDAKFFTKNDLMTHSLRHSDEMPFQCVACDRKFKRLVLLKRHEKLIHSDIPQLPCPNCPATFLSIEELEAHQRRHVRHTERTHECPVCEKKFHEKSTLQRHMDLVHEREPTFRCEYCPEQYTSISKLARHVRSHAGERPYPCKFCEKSFLKSHHYTRHLRLKHRKTIRTSRGPFGQADNYRCEQCAETFVSQDDLIYHSAIHATQNLICPLCQEKFENVDAVTAHIKSHVNGIEFMCDLCELVFTTKEKLDNHLTAAHADELGDEIGEDESSTELETEEFEDDNEINVKEEDGEMVVEIKKSAEFMLPELQTVIEDKPENINSEESEAEVTYTELSTVDTLAIVRKDPQIKAEIEKTQEVEPPKEAQIAATITKVVPKAAVNTDNQTASILRKAEEVKRRVQQNAIESTVVAERKKIVPKVESSNSAGQGGASDKSLRLLEKELQELKRTNTRNESAKPPAKTVENLRSSRRPQLYTSTPKARGVEEKKASAYNKSPALEKKVERRALTKENKEPRDTKATATARDEREREREAKEREAKEKEAKEKEAKDKEIKEKEKEAKEKEVKEKETTKSVVKNGTSDKTTPEDPVRRSTRPSKIKDYAKMIRDKSQDSSDDDSDDDAGDEEYKEVEKVEAPTRPKLRRASIKPPAKPAPPAPTPTPPARKRGRPRKEPKEVPAKIKKDDTEEESIEADSKTEKDDSEENNSQTKGTAALEKPTSTATQEAVEAREKTPEDVSKSGTEQTVSPKGGVIMSPSGQTLKKVPIRALPPGIKPLSFPVNARPMGPGELCEMQIGKKVVKVQKIVMTKAEVEAMAKQGLLEMKDGTMVLKQGIKLPTSEALKSSLVGEKAAKESQAK